MQKIDIKLWITDWFEKNTDLEKSQIEKNSNENYLGRGWIDSLKFIAFITDIEEKFDIRFSNEEFQNKEFASVDGISKIIEGKIDAKI